VIALERVGIKRKKISELLQEIGVDDSTMINIFVMADKKKERFKGKKLTQIILED